MQLGVDGVFVGSGIFRSDNPLLRGKAIVAAVTHFRDAKIIAEVSKGIGKAMEGVGNLKESQVAFRERGT
jgi:pyridoxal 5'-phosphate synthase pdxS subunit